MATSVAKIDSKSANQPFLGFFLISFSNQSVIFQHIVMRSIIKKILSISYPQDSKFICKIFKEKILFSQENSFLKSYLERRNADCTGCLGRAFVQRERNVDQSTCTSWFLWKWTSPLTKKEFRTSERAGNELAERLGWRKLYLPQ